MGPQVRQPQVQRAPNPTIAPVPTRPQPPLAQQGAPIYNPSGPQPQVMSGGMPVTAPVVAARPTAGPMPAPVGGIANPGPGGAAIGGLQVGNIGGSLGNVGQPKPGAPPVASTGMPPGQLPMMRR